LKELSRVDQLKIRKCCFRFPIKSN